MIKDYHDTSSVGILLLSDESLQSIYKNSGPLANANEYQVHYWALVLRKQFEDSSVLDICIPTVFYNYKQEVSPAHIDFDLKDVEAMSNALLPLHNAEVNKITKLFTATDFTLMSVPFNSIHKHPGGRSQAFSETDLHKDAAKNPGVVFPLSSADNQPNFASIMCVTDKCYLAHNEYRLAEGNVTDEVNGLSYYKGRSAAHIYAKTHYPTKAEQLFGFKPYNNSYAIHNELSTELPAAVADILEILNNSCKSNTDFIKPENVTKSAPIQYKLGTSNYSKVQPSFNYYGNDYYTKEEILAVQKMYNITILEPEVLAKLAPKVLEQRFIQFTKLLDPKEIILPEELKRLEVMDVQLLQDDMVFEATNGAAQNALWDDEDDLERTYLENAAIASGCYTKSEVTKMSTLQLERLFDGGPY